MLAVVGRAGRRRLSHGRRSCERRWSAQIWDRTLIAGRPQWTSYRSIPFIDIERARIASRGYPGAVPVNRNVLPVAAGCATTARHRPGPVSDGLVACVWQPRGRSRREWIWSALDCATGWSWPLQGRAGDRLATDRGIVALTDVDAWIPADPYVVVAGQLSPCGSPADQYRRPVTRRWPAGRGGSRTWLQTAVACPPAPPIRPPVRPSAVRPRPGATADNAHRIAAVWTPTRRTRSRGRIPPRSRSRRTGRWMICRVICPHRSAILELAVAVGVEPAHRPCVPLHAQLLTVEDVLQGALGRGARRQQRWDAAQPRWRPQEVSSTSIAWMSVGQVLRWPGAGRWVPPERSDRCTARRGPGLPDMTAYAYSSRAFCGSDHVIGQLPALRSSDCRATVPARTREVTCSPGRRTSSSGVAPIKPCTLNVQQSAYRLREFVRGSVDVDGPAHPHRSGQTTLSKTPAEIASTASATSWR